MGAAIEKTQYEIFSVEGTTDERYIVLWVPERFFNSTTSTPRGTTLSNFMVTEDIGKGDALDSWSTSTLTDTLPKERGCLKFVFHLPKTDDEALTPLRTPYRTFEDIQWPNELRYLYAVKGEMVSDIESVKSDQSMEWGAYGQNFYNNHHNKILTLDRYGVVPGGTYATEVEVEEFFSPVPFTDIAEEQLVPTVVQYSWNEVQNSLSCLHDDVFVPEVLTAAQSVPEFGTANARGMSFSGQFFPRTNFTRWSDFTWRDRQVERDGGFYRKRITAFPPPAPKIHKL